MKSKYGYALAAIFILALALRLNGLADDRSYREDDRLITAGAWNYVQSGSFMPDDWIQPPFKFLLLRASMALFGDNAYGWRMKNIILGSLTVFVLFLLSRELFRDDRVGLLAALFLAIEPLHIMYSGTIYEEISATFFFLLSLLLLLRYLRGTALSLVPSGICLALAFSQKWYYLFTMPLFLFYAVYARRRDSGGTAVVPAVHAVAVFGLLPLGIYLLTFYPWIRNGSDLAEFVGMQADAYRILQGSDISTFVSSYIRSSPSAPREWFIKPILYGSVLDHDGAWFRLKIFMSNFPVWLLACPAAIHAALVALREKRRDVLFLVVLFAVMYLQFALIERPMFMYSAIVVLPFVYLFVAHGAVSLVSRLPAGAAAWTFRGIVLATAFWGLYLYPLAAELPVPVALYAPLMRLGTMALP